MVFLALSPERRSGISCPAMRALMLLGLALAAGCTNYRDQLDRADAHYHAARYEHALGNLEDLHPDLDHLDRDERVRYLYLRGMTSARLNHRAEARHWLALAREAAQDTPSALGPETRALLERTLHELDERDTPAAPPATPAASTEVR